MKRITFILIFSIFLMGIYSQNSKELKSINKDSNKVLAELNDFIKKWLGVPYKVGGLNKNGIDCSGFATVIYKELFHINLPRTVDAQSNLGIPIAGAFKTGDLLFFNTTGKISHVGIYLSNNQFAHAASQGPSIGIIISSLNERYYKDTYRFARRVIDLKNINDTKTKNESREENKNSSIDLILGNKLHNDNVAYEREFKNGEEIFFQINNFSKNIGDIVFEILYNNSKVNRYAIKFDNNKYVSRMSVVKGSYSFRILNNNNLLVEKKIIVE